MRTSHFARLPLAVLPAAAGPLPLAGICDVVEVINTACGQREGAGVKKKRKKLLAGPENQLLDPKNQFLTPRISCLTPKAQKTRFL